MITLGLNAAFHDSAAAIVVDGLVVAAAEEERFTRIKHGKRPVPFTAWELPFNAIAFCLERAGVRLCDVDHVAYSFDPDCFVNDRADLTGTWPLPFEPSAQSPGVWENAWDPLFVAYVLNAPRQLRDGVPHHLRRRLRHEGDECRYLWHFVNHHTCHQASAFLAAPFDRCAVMTLDGRGERASTTYGIYRDGRYRSLREVHVPHSLGLLYEQVTSHLGFLHSSDEYKVMALAALGTPSFADALRECVRLHGGGQYTIEGFEPAPLFGPRRQSGAPLEQRHFDAAASLQLVLEEAALALARWLRAESGERQLAMAGGVALNCLMNSRLRDSGLFDAVWIQPAAGDAGTALGAALWVDACERNDGGREPGSSAALAPRRWQMEHAYLGPEETDEEIEALLQWAKLRYRRLEDVPGAVAELLAGNRIVGWYQGRMEFGPRALGARSILASPISVEMKARMNELKDREDFRPVAPAVPQELLAEWFTPAAANAGVSPFMLFIYDALPRQRELIPSACHSDGTARVQTVSAASNPRFHALLHAFGRLTGVPVLINTSFNVRGEPIVGSPKAAIEAFFSTPLDALAIGSFLVEKGP